jgi:hypothetical protein
VLLEDALDLLLYLGIIGNADSGQTNWRPLRYRERTP